MFDIDIESFDEKPWRHPGVDISDFFNFGLDEEHWKDYCRQLVSCDLFVEGLGIMPEHLHCNNSGTFYKINAGTTSSRIYHARKNKGL